MTTNVYDGRNLMMASDSRWSIPLPSLKAVVVDNTGFDKIEVEKNRVFMFAGDGKRIHLWKQWLRTPSHQRGEMPEFDGVSVCGVRIKDGSVRFKRAQLEHGQAWFAGSGKEFARECWSVNCDARKAVSTAMASDVLSGGDVKFFSVRDRSHNLDLTSTYDSVVNMLETKGNVMYKVSPDEVTVVPFSEAIKTDVELQALAKQIASGAAQFEAPCDLARQPWTEQEIADFKAMLAEEDE